MKLAIAFLTIALSLSLPLAGARRPLFNSPPVTPRSSDDDDDEPVTPDPQGSRPNLTDVLTLDGPFQTFLKYLQHTHLVEVFEDQAYQTDHGVTIFVPHDQAFAAVKPPGLSNLRKQQLKNLMMYHSLAKYYELADFDGLSQSNPVTTYAGGQYTVNVTADGGTIHVRSRWADAKIVGSVYVAEPMAVYELDRVLLPDAIFHAQPPVAAIPPAPAPAPEPSEDDVALGSASDVDVTSPDTKAKSSAGSTSWRDRPATAAALGGMALVVMAL